MCRKKKQEQDDFAAKLKEQGINVMEEPPTKNPIKRFWEWSSAFREISNGLSAICGCES